MKKHILLMVLWQCLCLNHLFANTNKIVQAATVTVHVTDTALLKQPLFFDWITDHIYSTTGSNRRAVMADKNGNYVFQLKNLNAPVEIMIATEMGLITGRNFLEAGDDIHIEFYRENVGYTKDKITYSGKGGAKFIVRKALSEASYQPLRFSLDHRYTISTMDSLIVNTAEAYGFKKKILAGYKNQLSATVYNLLDAEIFGIAYSSLITYLGLKKEKPTEEAIRYLIEKVKKIQPGFDATTILWSNNYLEFLYDQALVSANPLGSDSKKNFPGTVNEIIRLYKGQVREKVLLQGLLRINLRKGIENLDQAKTNALNYISNPKYRKLVNEAFDSAQIGAAAYNFTSPNTEGRMVSLSDFKGKVVVLDVWFTGCSNCVDLAKVVERELLPNFKDNKEVAFVSVSTDLLRQTWLKSVKSGRYTSPLSINVYTEGKAEKHPFAEKYHIQGGPYLFLIDREGKIYSMNMRGTGPHMTNMINEALKAPSK